MVVHVLERAGAAACLALYAAESVHHRVSELFLGPATEFRQDIEDVAQGGAPTPRLTEAYDVRCPT